MATVYIAGPMTGLPDFNYPAFHAAAAAWRAVGWIVSNPAENFAGHQDLPYADYIRKDLADLMACEAIALLPGWVESRGANLEHHVAAVLDMRMYDALMPVAP